MSVETDSRNEFILEAIPPRGEPPYFVHSGTGSLPHHVHGAIKNGWVDALLEISDLTNYGLYASTEQIIVGVPVGTGRLTLKELAEYQPNVVFDMKVARDVQLLRSIDE